jgi:hypothetical protein
MMLAAGALTTPVALDDTASPAGQTPPLVAAPPAPAAAPAKAATIAAIDQSTVTGNANASAVTGRPEGIGIAGSSCRAAYLPTLGSGLSEVRGGDPSGRYLVGREHLPASSITAAVVWTDHKVRELDTSALLPYVDVTATDVNRHGTIVGYRTRDHSSFHEDAWMYREGRFTLLPGLRSTDATVPAAINSRGDVVGYSLETTGTTATFHAVLWPADRPGTVRELTVPGQPAAWLRATDIDEDGTVLGFLGGWPGQTYYIWRPNGVAYPLSGPAAGQVSEATAIRNGWVVGYGQTDGQSVGLRWNLRTGGVQIVSTQYPFFRTINSTGTIAAIGAIIHRDGRAVPLGDNAVPIVLTDRGTAAGMFGFFTPPVIWTGC